MSIADAAVGALNFSHYWSVIKRERPLIAIVTVLCILAMAAYCLLAQPMYTATGSILIDIRKNQLLQNSQVVAEMQLDPAGSAIESQVELLKSESVALAVIRELKLVDDPIFAPSGPMAVVAYLKSLFKDGDTSAYERERNTVEAFDKALKVKRSNLTYIIDIEFTSSSAERSAQIVNALADAYMVNELDARYEATRRASRWLQDRIKELREQATAAEQKVQDFRAQNNIIDTNRGRLSEQQLADVNTQLLTAQAATAEAKAKLDQINRIANGNVPDATVADALKNEVITRLRAQYLDLSSRYADMSSRYGANHQVAINLRNQMNEIRRSITDELRRIADSYKSDFEVARARETSLQKSLAELISQAGTSGQAQVTLRDLESSAQTARNLYDSFLQRFLEASQQQTLPINEARLITAATPPIEKSWPKTKILLPGSLVLGLMLGVAAALMRDRLDDVFRTPKDVESYLGVECLGILPLVRPGKAPAPTGQGSVVRPISRKATITRYVADAPFSRFTESMRSVKVAIDISGLTREARVIGVVSAVPNEGKTTFASNLATLMAQNGQKVLLIDGDLRNPRLTQALAPDAKAGLFEVLTQTQPLSDVLYSEAGNGLQMLPAVLKGPTPHTAEMISSRAMAALLDSAGSHYNYIVIDLPPIISVVDVRAAAHLIDAFVCVTEWGQTSREVVAEAFASVDVLRDRLVGLVLNKADPSALKRIESYKGRHYQSYYLEPGDPA
ncbi:polysaccharide biosynthesis tyrosine autokinase [uncultured Methylobacterium sp.]|uniref:polysaccharide biosynthesis tyrosine autokinase n=1 Tax=uncultured Methylobacterium sp. TaxID=157278 RepID=UPI0026294DC1|nr:polysaccharide biosynthesis tyrosine autokinase [uncultured Methylobacterium sp.]